MTDDEAKEEIVYACQCWVNRLWEFDQYQAANEKEARETMTAVKHLFGVDLRDPWAKKS